MTCQTCNLIEEREGMVVYSDPYAHIVLPENPASKGHVRVYTREHAESMDDLEYEELEHIMQAGTLTASLLFEQLGAHGTNIIINEGSVSEGHLSMDIVARKEDDDLNFQWQPKEFPEPKMEDVQGKIKDQTDLIGHETTTTETKTPPTTEEKETISDDEENPMIKQLRKIP